MQSSNPVRWGIIGAGDVAEHKSGPPLYRTPGSELIAVMRRDADKASAFARRHGARRWYTDARELVADPEVNAVYVASPHDLHLEHVRLAARAGKPVLCEKPLGRSAVEAQAIVDVCSRHHVSLTVAYYRRFWYITRAIQRLLNEGAIGEIVQARAHVADNSLLDPSRTWNRSLAKSGGGALANTGSHWIDLLRFFLGDFADAMGYAVPDLTGDEVDRIMGAQLRTKSGVLVSVMVNVQSPLPLNDLELIGTEGRILGSPYSEGRYVVERSHRQTEVVEFNRYGPAHTELISELVPRLQAGELSPLPGDEAVAIWKIMEAVYRSCVEGTRVTVAW